MKTSSKLLIALGIAAAFVISAVAGVPLGTLLFVAALLACPAIMFFGMGMQQGGCQHCDETASSPAPRNAGRTTAEGRQ